MAAFKVGTLFSGGVLVYFMDFISSKPAFLILGIIYFICFSLLYVILKDTITNHDKTKEEDTLSFKQRIILLHESPGTYWICIFVLIYKLGKVR